MADPERHIEPGDPRGVPWTFTAERWDAGSYLRLDGDRVLLSFVVAKQRGRGYLTDLVTHIETAGLRVAVPTPLSAMEAILLRWFFRPHIEHSKAHGAVTVWERKEIPAVRGVDDAALCEAHGWPRSGLAWSVMTKFRLGDAAVGVCRPCLAHLWADIQRERTRCFGGRRP